MRSIFFWAASEMSIPVESKNRMTTDWGSSAARRTDNPPAPPSMRTANLVTGMVGEFPELQGVMGRYYALSDASPEHADKSYPISERPWFYGLSSGALVALDEVQPSVQGSIVYISVQNVSTVLERVQAHGGDTLVPRTALPEGMGFFAQFRDCEGNRVGLWSPV